MYNLHYVHLIITKELIPDLLLLLPLTHSVSIYYVLENVSEA